MSTIGQQLLQPESGWKRYDDTNINFEYKGLSLNSRNYGYNSDVHFGNASDVYVRFNYKSKKGLRVVSPTAWDATAVKVMVDGVLNGSFNQYSSSIVSSVFVYELKGDGKEHSVEISKQNVNSSYLYWDTIDVDENGKLKPYNPNVSSKKYTDNIIPIMTSDENTNIKLSCSAYYITQTGSKKLFPYLAFDNTVNSAWNFENQSQPTGGHWLKIFFKDRTRCIAKITIRNGVHASESVKNFKLQGSNDDILYEDIYVGFHPYGDLDTSKAIYEFDNNESYKYYRILIIDSYYSQSTTYGGIGELEMMEEVLPNKYLIKQNNNYYSINNNYIDLGKIDNSEELNNIMDEYGYNDLSILTKELNNKRIPTKLENDYYKSFDINLNDIKDNIHLMEQNDKKYIEYDCDNYKISDKVKEINNAKFEVLMKE